MSVSVRVALSNQSTLLGIFKPQSRFLPLFPPPFLFLFPAQPPSPARPHPLQPIRAHAPYSCHILTRVLNTMLLHIPPPVV